MDQTGPRDDTSIDLCDRPRPGAGVAATAYSPQRARLHHCGISRESDYIARLGGDEFALLHLYAHSPASGGMLAEKLLYEMAQPFQISGREVRISARIGIAVCPVDAKSPDSLLKKADLALYHAKNAGRNRYHYYTAALDELAHRKNADHNELRRVLPMYAACAWASTPAPRSCWTRATWRRWRGR
ncbi:diguanylate cyclase [Duganella sp. FT94W]|uniref:Diguanylate cyclase n=1 Tax=Duganella lactea TaxID=2692173 RepID=A0ABW9VFN1_9BURK|nr:GGDEF domain-containing protein [Duganella lactea]MYM37434.1 diguanylate cyclase [Duganella lactea]